MLHKKQTPFNSLFSRTTWLSQYQKGKTSLDFTEARDYGVLERQWIICRQSAPRSRQIAIANTPSVNSVDALLDFQPTVLLLTAEVKMKIYTIRTRLTDPYPG